MKKRKLYMVSEFTDPCYYVDTAISRLSKIEKPCAIIITKDIGKCEKLIDYCNSAAIPFITHATITGLAGTELEPNVPATDKVLADLERLIKSGKVLPERAVIRVDPIVPFYSNIVEIEKIIAKASELGIKSCRISIVDYYRHVIDRMRQKQLQHGPSFQMATDNKDKLIDSIFRITRNYNIKLYLCAEFIPENLDKQWISNRGCASLYDWQKLGVELDDATRHQRANCTCDAEKQDLLYGLRKGCSHECTYCYLKW